MTGVSIVYATGLVVSCLVFNIYNNHHLSIGSKTSLSIGHRTVFACMACCSTSLVKLVERSSGNNRRLIRVLML